MLFRLLTVLVVFFSVVVTGVRAQPVEPLAIVSIWVSAMDFSSDSKNLALSVGRWEDVGFLPLRYEVWNKDSGRRLQSFSNQMEQNPRVLFSPDGTKLIGYGLRVREGKEPEVRATVWQIDSGEKLFDLPVEEPQGYFTHMAFSPDGTSIVGIHQLQREGKRETSVYVWDANTGASQQRWHDSSYHPVAAHYIDNNQKLLLAGWNATPGGSHTSLQELDLRQGKITRTHAIGKYAIARSVMGDGGNPLALYWVNIGEQAGTAAGLEVLQWQSPQTPLSLTMSRITPLSLHFNSEGNELHGVALSLEQDRKFQLCRWDTQTGDSLGIVTLDRLPDDTPYSSIIDSKAEIAAIAIGPTVKLHRTSDGELLQTLQVD